MAVYGEMKSEANIQNAILIALSEAGCLVWRQNTGAYKDKTGRVIRYGLCVGSSDIVGICPDGIALFIEVKTKNGAIRPEQKKFIEACIRSNARAGIARSVEDALRIAFPT